MSTGFIALSNHGIDTTLFQPARFFYRRRRRDNLATRRLDLRDPRRRPYMRNGGYVTSRPASAAPIAGRC